MKHYHILHKNHWIRDIVFLMTILQVWTGFKTQAGPLREKHICGLARCKDGKKFHYKAGGIYTYAYTVNGTSSIEAGPSEEAGLHLSAKVALKFLTACDVVLSIKDVQVWESHAPSPSASSLKDHHFTRSDSEETFSVALTEYSLRLSFADGFITEICPHPNESVLMLNVKRGLLSAFQNTMRRLDLEHKGEEEDIYGRCKVEYKLSSATSSTLTIERSKDISSCGDRFGILSAVQGTPYHFGTLHQSMPAVSSTADCEHVVDRNLVAGVRCSETHRLKSLARGAGGAQTQIFQTLDLISIYNPAVGERKGGKGEDEEEGLPSVSRSLDPIFAYLSPIQQTDVGRRESLQFKHDYQLSWKPNDHHAAKNALLNFCSSIKEGIGESSAEAFEKLVTIMRGLTSTDMMSLNEEATDLCQDNKTSFDDALEAVGTAASVLLMKDRILKGDASQNTINSWIASLTYIPRPDLALMQSAVEILRKRGNHPQILLSYSSLANSYCRRNPDCVAHRPIDILSRLYRKVFVETNCAVRKPSDVEQIVMYLKGIGNFGIYSAGIKDALGKCIHENDVSEIRVAAIEAYRRMGCNIDSNSMKGIFENHIEDSEVRIAAFLTLMRCPTYETIQFIKTSLEAEEVNQVGSFVVSYMKNLQETALPSKAELQGLVSDEKFSERFSLDFRKLSRNYEISAFYDDFNLGAGLETNLIFSQKSYLPRTAMLNLTVDLFGESVNVFEATLRLENFEHYIESLFGPNGKFQNNKVKRATPNKRKLRQLALEFDAMKRYNENPIASFSLKTFGNEILYERTAKTSGNLKFMDVINPFEYIKTLGSQGNIQKSKMLLDSVYIIPTGIGLPLNLTAQASAILKMDGDTEFASNPAEFKVKGKLNPSAIVSVTGGMIFGTTELQVGIKVKAHIRSAAAIEGTLHVKGRELIQAEFGSPDTKLELLDYKSELLFMRGKVLESVGELPWKAPICTREFLDQVVGLRLCRSSYFNLSPNSEVDNLSSPYFPLNGPARYRVTIEKTNPSAISTKLTYASTSNETNSMFEATYGIRTTQDMKSFGFTFDMDKINQTFALGITFPSNDLKLSGIMRTDQSSGKVDLTAISNRAQILYTMISFVKTGGNGKALLKPEILIKLYNRRILDANGEVELISIDGGTSFEGTGGMNLDDSSTLMSLYVSGLSNSSRIRVEVNADYRTREDPLNTQTVKWKSTIRRDDTRPNKRAREIDASLSLQFSEFQDYNLEASWKYEKDEDKINSEGELVFGKNPAWSDQAFKIRHKFHKGITFNASRTAGIFRVMHLAGGTDWGLEWEVDSHGKSFDSTINLYYAPGKRLETSLALVREPQPLITFCIEGSLKLTNQPPLKLKLRLNQTAHRIYEGNFVGDWFGKGAIQVRMDFADETRRHKVDKDLSFSVEFGKDKHQLFKVGSHLTSDDKESKLSLRSEYQSKHHSWEMGHVHLNKGSKRHRLYSTFKEGPNEYFLTIEFGIDHRGLEITLETSHGLKLPEIHTGLRVTRAGGLSTIGFDYKWGDSGDESKNLQFLTSLDFSAQNQAKYKLILKYPGRNFIIFAEQSQYLNRSQSINGRISWNSKQQIVFNGNFHHIRGVQNSYELVGLVQTPFIDIENASIKLRFDCALSEDCLISIDSFWGKRGKVSTIIRSQLEYLPIELFGEKGVSHEEENVENDERKDDDIEKEVDGEESSRRRRRHGFDKRETKRPEPVAMSVLQPSPYRLRLNSRLSTSVEGWESLRIRILHTEHDPLHLKTDIDIQFPEGNDLTLSAQWDIPRTLKEMWSTRVHLMTRTPFRNYETFDLQAVVGQQEDGNALVTFGIYTDHSHTSITITGTPKFDKDGSIQFDIITSVPNYDKIFGSLSYAIGESSRLACQLGWPKVVVGFETGFEWSGSWEGFQVFYNFNSPWEPLTNINTLAKINSSQAEFKCLLNDEGVIAKSVWIFESVDRFDIRFDATSPFEAWERVGLIAKHSFDGSVELYSQVSGWLNDDQIGYKWEIRRSELEEEEGVRVQLNSEVEVETIVYPTVRWTLRLGQMEAEYNLDASLLLREGPINFSLELNLLDLFRFNEKITITTPYPGLLELEINLTPAIIPDRRLYNFGLQTQWRSSTGSEEAGLHIRLGDQKALSDALRDDMDYDYYEEWEDEEYEFQQKEPKEVTVPTSQLLYFYSPLSWVSLIKIEIEKDSDPPIPQRETNARQEVELMEISLEDTNEIYDRFPLKFVVFTLDGVFLHLGFLVQNEIGEKTLSAHISFPEILNPVSLRFESKLDVAHSEKKLSVHGVSHWPNLREIRLESSFQREINYLNARVDLNTPFLSWERQHASVMYASTKDKDMDTLDLELFSDEFGKLGTNIVRSPRSFNIILNTPIHEYQIIEVEWNTEIMDDVKDMSETVIFIKVGDAETLRVELNSTLEDNFLTLVKGIITTTLRKDEPGNLEAMMRRSEDELNANGRIVWGNEKLTLSIQLKFVERSFQELDIQMKTPFEGYKCWKLKVQSVDESKVESSDEGSMETSSEDYSQAFLVEVETPWTELSPFDGKFKVTKGPSLLMLKQFTLTGDSPKASVNIKTSWLISNWNSFEIHCDSNYLHELDRNGRLNYLAKFPESNFIKFKVRNFVSTLDRSHRLDSAVYYETESPLARFGSTAFINFEGGESLSSQNLNIKLSSRLSSSSHSMEFSTIFEDDLKSLASKLILASSPPSLILTSTLQLTRWDTSLEGEGVFEWGRSGEAAIQSKFNCTYNKDSPSHFHADFFQPKSQNPIAVIGSIDGNFDGSSGQHNIRVWGKQWGGEENLLVDFDLNYRLNEITLPSYLDSAVSIRIPDVDFPHFIFYIHGNIEEGYLFKVGGSIGSRKASLLCDWVFREFESGATKVNGTFGLELPLSNQRSTLIQIYSTTLETKTTGEFQMLIDGVKHIDSTFNFNSSVKERNETYHTKLHVRNQFWPFGVTKVYKYEISPGPLNSEMVQLIEVYDLIQSDIHRLGGELRIHTDSNGSKITLTGIHPFRNVSLVTSYQVLDRQYRQNTAFNWAPESWMGFELLLQNTTTELMLGKQMELKIRYPVRLITFTSGISLEGQSGQLTAQLDLNATTKERPLAGIINWDTEDKEGQTVHKIAAVIKHPSLAQDIWGGGEFRFQEGNSLDARFSLDYSADPKRRVGFQFRGTRFPEDPYYWNLTTEMRLQHAATNLDLKAFHFNRHLPHEISIISLIDFKNSGKVSQESKITFELFKQLKKLHLMFSNPDEKCQIGLQFKEQGHIYYFVGDTNITNFDPSPKAEFLLDMKQPSFRLIAVYGKDGSDGIYGEGGVINARNVKFDISESYDNFRVSDVNFFLRMNHSRLVTSKLIWRPELLDELQASYVNRMEDLKRVWTHQTDKLVSSVSFDAAQIYSQVWENARTTIEPLMEEIRKDCNFQKDSEALAEYFEEALERNDFYMEDVTGLAQIFADQISLRFSDLFINLQAYREEILGESTTSELFEQTLLWILEKAKEQYRLIIRKWESYKSSGTFNIRPSLSVPFPQFSNNFSYFLHQCLESIIKTNDLVGESISSLMSSTSFFLREKLQDYKPEISGLVHQVEIVAYQCLVYASDFIYETRNELLQSSYYKHMSQLSEDVDQFYNDLLENEMATNAAKYYELFLNFLQKKTNFKELKDSFCKLYKQIGDFWMRFMNLDSVQQFRASIIDFYESAHWIVEYTRINELAYQTLLNLYEKGPELITQSVLEANAKYQQAKTKFIFDADKGVVDWEQKLPMPWSAFNVAPIISELPEYQGIVKAKEFFESSGNSVFDTFYHTPKSANSFFPFDGHAMVAGSEYFFTFDGRIYNFHGTCVYLLAGDLVEGNFTVSIDFKGMESIVPNHSIIITSNHNTLIIDLERKTLRDPKRPQNVGLPIQMHHLQGYQDGMNLIVESPKEDFSIRCNMVSQLCELSVSGWYSRKIGGLLGTMDHEPTTDLIHSNGKVAQDINDMAKSWDVSDDRPGSTSSCITSTNNNQTKNLTQIKPNPESEMSSTCKKLFLHRLSSFQPCFKSVDVAPYLEMCLRGKLSVNFPPPCLAAITYVKMCQANGIVLHAPSICVKCDLNGEVMIDRDIKMMDRTNFFSRSADIVFIVEAKDCNKNLYMRRRMETLLNGIETELNKANFSNNKYGVVAFGGEGVFKMPKSVIVRGEFFTDFRSLEGHFKTIQTSNSDFNRDTFGAISHALSLNFRPSGSKILILLPCTTCQPEDMTMDFSAIQHALVEYAATLHILMLKDFRGLLHSKAGKKLFGMDDSVTYSKVDGIRPGPPRGNVNLRRKVKLSKQTLGYCIHLALQTNGTIFNGEKLQNKRERTINSFARVFSRRVAKLEPPPCVTCVCAAKQDGIGVIKCLPCEYKKYILYNNPDMDLEDNAEQTSETLSREELENGDEEEGGQENSDLHEGTEDYE